MMRIESVSASPDRVGRYKVTLEDGSVLRLYRQTVQDFLLYPGKELGDEELESLYTAAGAMSAKMRAVRIISASNVAKRDLEQRLIQKGEDPAQARDAVAWLSEMSLVDDAKTAQNVVEHCIRKGYGKARAKQALYEKRIPKEYWEDALSDYPDQEDAIESFLRQRLTDPEDERAVKKAIDALIRRGHSYGNIRRVLQRLCVDNDLLEDV